MKKIIVLFAFLMVGIVGESQAIERYYTSNSTGVTVSSVTQYTIAGSTNYALEDEIKFGITAVYLENGFSDGAQLIIVDSNTQVHINNGGSFTNPYNIPVAQWLSPPLYFITSTGTTAGIQNRQEYKYGLRAENGFSVFVTSGASTTQPKRWTLELTPLSDIPGWKR